MYETRKTRASTLVYDLGDRHMSDTIWDQLKAYSPGLYISTMAYISYTFGIIIFFLFLSQVAPVSPYAYGHPLKTFKNI